MHPWKQQDGNQGGGKSNVMTSQFGDYAEDGTANGKPSVTSTDEVMAITIADDRRLSNLERNKRVVEYCLDQSDSDTVTIINELYIKKVPTLTLNGVAHKVNLSVSQVKRRRTKFFEMMREQIGW